MPRGQYFKGKRGAASEYVSIPWDKVSTIPDGLSAVDAAALVTTVSTALLGLRDKAKLQPGEKLLVRGASGGLGSAAVQVGKALGAHVTGLARAENADRVKELGADEVFDYRTTKPADLGKFDVIFDAVGTDLYAFRRQLAPGGRMMGAAIDFNRFLRSALSGAASAVFGSRRIRTFSASPDAKLLGEVRDLVAKTGIRAPIAGVRPLAEIADAHRALEKGGGVGKQVLVVSES
jgi:NADPH:quinone reductase-like Zn-dependent oxidoreductase